jgi:hypothetical protein
MIEQTIILKIGKIGLTKQFQLLGYNFLYVI